MAIMVSSTEKASSEQQGIQNAIRKDEMDAVFFKNLYTSQKKKKVQLSKGEAKTVEVCFCLLFPKKEATF